MSIKYIDILKKQCEGNKFISFEPQVESITDIDLLGINWVIHGSESWHFRRKFLIDWARELRNICNEHNIPYFLKQMHDKNGNVIKNIKQFTNDLQIRKFPQW